MLSACHQDKKQDEFAHNKAQKIEKPAPPKIEYGFNLDDYTFKRDTVKSGDSFGFIMNLQGISSSKVHNVVEQVKDSFDVRKIVVGKPYIVVKDKSNPDEIAAFIYIKDNINYTVVSFADSIASASQAKLPVTTRRKTISGVINSSLSQSMSKAGAGLSLINGLANIFQWKIDLFHIQKGDKFKVIFNVNYINDSIYAGIENIDAAEFTHYNEPYYAFRYGKDSVSGFSKFYDDEASSLQNFFLKAPVKFTRISSRYTKRRFHPVQHRWKSHLGTDYAAPTGTPIHSTADGVVIASQYTRFNGNYVKIRHNSKYTTQYLHMSKRLVRVGQHVKQGQNIGLVGQTGLATGPHVCYRFWVNGKQVDPYGQKMPSSDPLSESLKPDFYAHIKPLKKELDNITVEDKVSEENYAGALQ